MGCFSRTGRPRRATLSFRLSVQTRDTGVTIGATPRQTPSAGAAQRQQPEPVAELVDDRPVPDGARVVVRQRRLMPGTGGSPAE